MDKGEPKVGCERYRFPIDSSMSRHVYPKLQKLIKEDSRVRSIGEPFLLLEYQKGRIKISAYAVVKIQYNGRPASKGAVFPLD